MRSQIFFLSFCHFFYANLSKYPFLNVDFLPQYSYFALKRMRMSLKEIVYGILKEKRRSVTWLAEEMGRTFDGLRTGLVNESVKYKDMVVMAEVLKVSPNRFFETIEEHPDPEQNMVSEESIEYKRLKSCEELVATLKKQINDKERIISLLTKGNIDAEQNR